MRRMWELVLRNTKMYFKDMGMFLTSLITPAILLILFMTFLGSIYKNSFVSAIPKGLEVSDKWISCWPIEFGYASNIMCYSSILF